MGKLDDAIAREAADAPAPAGGRLLGPTPEEIQVPVMENLDRFVTGLITFSLISSVGAVMNVNVSAMLFGGAHSTWYYAGLLGAVMSLVGNYAVSSAITWRR